jgi:ABC-type transport system involved in multi-copper enzyme maturation permease subunit
MVHGARRRSGLAQGAALDALMTVLPVIVRELRASSRQPLTYSLRVLGAAVLLLAGALFGLRHGFEPSLGRVLFRALHVTLFGAIWVLVPMLTADCISRERREGTLGLLFLTPLKGTDIVVAKGLAQGLRAVTLGLAVLPVLTIPFLMGGVSWTEAALSVVVNANAMCWALAAGLLASAWSTTWSRALLSATMLALAFLVVLGTAAGELLMLGINRTKPGPALVTWDTASAAGFVLLTNAAGFWSEIPRWVSGKAIAWTLAQTTCFSLLMLVLVVLAAGARIRRSWQELPPPRWQVRLEQIFCTPVLWRAFYQRWMRRKLERNPIGWLEQRTWNGRLVTWGWVAVLISVYSTVLTDRHFSWVTNSIQELMAWLLAGSLAASAAGSFRRERETAVLELLLVSPLGTSQIISGRLRGLWGQFLPAAGLLLAVWLYSSSFLPNPSGAGVLLFYAVMFLSVPVFGLYYSLRCRNFLGAFLLTVAVGMLLPLGLAQLITFLWWAYGGLGSGFPLEPRASSLAAVCQALLAANCCWWLYRRLKLRTFPLERTPGS